VLTKTCEKVGIDPAAFFAGIGEQATKDKLKSNTDEAIRRGAFGSPTIYFEKTDMYFGNDRLPLLRAAIMRKKDGKAWS
jgi:2-hydroxychromene-2-carboxylate isomerase